MATICNFCSVVWGLYNGSIIPNASEFIYAVRLSNNNSFRFCIDMYIGNRTNSWRKGVCCY